MTGIGEAAALAALQGLTEFLPVSSSGHLVLARSLLGAGTGGITFEVVVHVGTLIAVLAVYARDLAALVGGLLLADRIEAAFDNPLLASVMLLATGAILYSTRSIPSRTTEIGLGPGRALLIGASQAVAILPGISRSGSTIAAGLHCGLGRRQAARFSFLLAIPAIAGAALLEVPKADFAVEWPPLLTGLAVSAIVGYAALRLLLRFLDSGRIHLFAWYCWAAGAAGVILATVGS
jgi:undecaprenyl-diphosphatase